MSYSPPPGLSTVAQLPTATAAMRGVHYMITDALTPVALAAVVGGGAVTVEVYCNGTIWAVL